PTSGVVTVTDTLPAGLNATNIAGTGWTCVLGTLTCGSTHARAPGTWCPPMPLTATDANNAAASVTNTATVSGGGQTNTANDTANAATTINLLPDLTITMSHSLIFTLGRAPASSLFPYTTLFRSPTSGVVTVTDTLPAGLNATNIAGTGWTCVLGTL